ncbi:DNA polymerase III subunit beta [Desertibacillus haloalkaliphilus]|uniref:DNA polymerase III subunit beta n=1 Tax=Desertibacillus haloalkaliphilus TaxID=1328930 RepID=UPI001C2715AD|nr:DNA polymerase III subunit beta [Desertibacillus haloalkaliphilus]MBU8908083.1 DNA polymerase III subunit beta [Desertibacillus haloalkaliphilus]
MKFSIDQKVMKAALKKAFEIVNNKSDKVILKGVQVIATEDEIVLTGSDAKNSIKVIIPSEYIVSIEDTGSTVFPDRAKEIIDKLSGDLSIETDGNNQTTIQTKKSSFEVNCWDASEFIKLPEIKSDPIVKLSSETFNNLVQKTAFSASTSETRPILQAVKVDISKDGLSMIATDSHRLANVIQPLEFDKEELSFPVEALSLESMTKVFGSHDVEIYLEGETQFIVKAGNTIFYSQLMNGNYPKLPPMNLSNFPSVVTLNRDEAIDCFEQIKIITKKKNNSGHTTFDFSGETVSLKGIQADAGKGTIDLDCIEHEGDPLRINMNIEHVLQALKNIDSDNVRFSLLGELKPYYITPTKSAFAQVNMLSPIR